MRHLLSDGIYSINLLESVCVCLSFDDSCERRHLQRVIIDDYVKGVAFLLMTEYKCSNFI